MTELGSPRPVDLLSPTQLKQLLPLNWVCAQLGVILDPTDRGLCPFHTDTVPSFRIFYNASGVEKWHCYPCNTGGDVFDLIQRVRSARFPDALDLAREYLNGLPAGYEPTNRKAKRAEGPDTWADDVIEAQRLAVDPLNAGFMAVSTGLAPRTTPAADLAETDRFLRFALGWGITARQGGGVFMPHWDRDGVLRGCKIRMSDGSRTSLRGSTYEDLYGQWLSRGFPTVLLTEGETDFAWLALQQPHRLSLDILSLPSGASQPILPCQLQTLERYDRVILGLDGDDPGRDAARRWRSALEYTHRVYDLDLPDGHDIRSWAAPLEVLLENAEPALP